MHKKANDQYYFLVEGETEKWYLEWLQKEINKSEQFKRTVSFKVEVGKKPLSYAKKLSVQGPTDIWHVFDYESNDECHVEKFREQLKGMKDAHKARKCIQYKNAYSNFTFELWIVLHKTDFTKRLNHRNEYCAHINKAFNEEFEDLDQYKHEKNFKRVLSKLSLGDVRSAILRSKVIALKNEEEEKRFAELYGYTYCLDNPHTELWNIINHILIQAETD